MITPPRLEYYGDIAQAQALKGAALQFFSFCCLGIGESLTITKTKKLNDTSIIQATVNKDPYGNLNGVVRINVAISGGETQGVLFCTSFEYNVDDGTKVYKNPYPPITKYDLIQVDDNPNGHDLPESSYRWYKKYWYDSKQKYCVNWDYVDCVVDGFKRKCGKIAIQGIETTSAWGVSKEIVSAAIDGELLSILYIDRSIYNNPINYAQYYYTLDFQNKSIILNPIFDVFVFNYDSTREYLGFFSDDFLKIAYKTNIVAGEMHELRYSSFLYVTENNLKTGVIINTNNELISLLGVNNIFFNNPIFHISGKGVSFGFVEQIGDNLNGLFDCKFIFFSSKLISKIVFSEQGWYSWEYRPEYGNSGVASSHDKIYPLFFDYDNNVIIYSRDRDIKSYNDYGAITIELNFDLYLNKMVLLERRESNADGVGGGWSGYGIITIASCNTSMICNVFARGSYYGLPSANKNIVFDTKKRTVKIINVDFIEHRPIKNTSVTKLPKVTL